MLVSILMLGLVTAFVAPVLTHQVFERVYEWERTQIYVDNATILLGRADRELFNFITTSNRRLKQWHLAHHVVHACAQIPKSSAYCRPRDIFLEKQISLFHGELHALSQSGWVKNARGVEGYLKRHEVLVVFSRKPSLPLRALHCPICRLPQGWELLGEVRQLATQLTAPLSRPVRTKAIPLGHSFSQKTAWDYRLADGRNDE